MLRVTYGTLSSTLTMAKRYALLHSDTGIVPPPHSKSVTRAYHNSWTSPNTARYNVAAYSQHVVLSMWLRRQGSGSNNDESNTFRIKSVFIRMVIFTTCSKQTGFAVRYSNRAPIRITALRGWSVCASIVFPMPKVYLLEFIDTAKCLWLKVNHSQTDMTLEA